MDSKKVSLGIALASSIGLAYSCPDKSPEQPNNTQTPSEDKNSFLNEAITKYEKYTQKRDDPGFRGDFEDAFRKLDELTATEDKVEVIWCKQIEDDKVCLMKLGDTRIQHERASYHPYNTRPGTKEESCRAFIYTGIDTQILVDDRYCDGKTDYITWIYENVIYGELEWEVGQEKAFFEKTADPLWAKITDALGK